MTRPFWTDGTVTIRHGNALALPLDDESVDLVVTSPPYFGLRSYQDDGEHYDGQVGIRGDAGGVPRRPDRCHPEMVRVLKPGGSIFVNLGDKYAQNTERPQRPGPSERSTGASRPRRSRDVTRPAQDNGVPTKSLMLLAGAVPDPVRGRPRPHRPRRHRVGETERPPRIRRDRVRRSHEDWVHLTKEPRYFTGIDEIREPHTARRVGVASVRRAGRSPRQRRRTSSLNKASRHPRLRRRARTPSGSCRGRCGRSPRNPSASPGGTASSRAGRPLLHRRAGRPRVAAPRPAG
jgi:hypothetical protein